jgi:DNA-binding LytR/AlgR family response regulator
MLNNSTITGIDLLEAIKDPKAWVIITSLIDFRDCYEQYRGLRFNKFFVQKPIDEYILKTKIDSFLFSQTAHYLSPTEEVNYVMLKLGKFMHKVLLSEISLIQTNDHATTVFTDKQKYITYTSLKTFEGLTKSKNFQKVNRNSLVNINTIKKVNLKENYIETDSHQIQISRGCKPLFVSKYADKNIIA